MAQTVIGSSTVIDGEITGEEGIVIQGTVKGKISIKDAIEVAQSAIVEAEVEAESMVVSGHVKGNIFSREKLEVTSEGRVVGDVKTSRILIADGAAFKGTVDMDVE